MPEPNPHQQARSAKTHHAAGAHYRFVIFIRRRLHRALHARNLAILPAERQLQSATNCRTR